MLKKSLLILLFLLGFTCYLLPTTLSYAQEKFGYVDLSRLFDEYEKTKEYDKLLEKKQDTKTKERDERQAEIDALKAKLATSSEKEKSKLQKEIDDKAKALREFERQAALDLRKERNNFLNEILKEIEKAVNKYAGENGYILIFNERVLLYGDKDLELTDELIKILNKGYKKK